MTQVTVLGANGQIAQLARRRLLEDTDAKLNLFARNSTRLVVENSERETVFEGDATDVQALKKAIGTADIVYANLAGSEMDKEAKAVVTAMNQAGVKRLIWISSIGIYDEVPGAFGVWNNEILKSYLPPYKRAAEIIEGSNLDYTIIRPAWLTNKAEVDYETTAKGETFKGTEVSRASIADVVVSVVKEPARFVRASIGVDKPGTQGDKPAWY